MSTANLRITPDDWRDATLTASITELVGFEALKTQNTIRGDVYRTADTTSVDILATWPAALTGSALYLFNHLLHGANFRLRLYSGAAWAGSPVYDSTALPALCYVTTNDVHTFSSGVKDIYRSQAASWLYFDEVSYQSAKLTLSGTPSAVSRFQLGRVVLGHYMEFARSLKFETSLGRETNSKHGRTQGGSRRGYRGGSWRVTGGELGGLNPDEFAAWMDFMNLADLSSDFGFSLFPGDGDRREELWTMDAYLSNLDALSHEVGVFTGRIQVEEA